MEKKNIIILGASVAVIIIIVIIVIVFTSGVIPGFGGDGGGFGSIIGRNTFQREKADERRARSRRATDADIAARGRCARQDVARSRERLAPTRPTDRAPP